MSSLAPGILTKFGVLRMSTITNSMKRMALRCPPEYLLRTARGDRAARQCRSVALSTQPCSSVATYRAAVCTELNKPLQIQPLEREALENGQVRVAVHNAGVNFGDVLMMQGLYQVKPDIPFVPGSELAGRVIEVAPDVTGLEPGDRVVGITPNLGAFAEEIAMNEINLFKIPDALEYPAAAALLVSYGTAYMSLAHRAKIQPGETVLVTAAAGGVGLAAVDLAANVFKAKVIAACGGPEKCAIAKQKGAFETIDYRAENMRDRVQEITDGEGANVIIDAVGGDTFKQCLKSIAFEGRLVVVGFASGDIPKVPANILLLKSCSLLGVYWGSYQLLGPEPFSQSVQQSMQLAATKQIQPHLSKVAGMHQVNDAMQFVKERKSTGKVVIDVRNFGK